LDLRTAHPLVVNTTRKAHLKPENLLVEPGRWATLDYQTIESPHVDSQLQWTAHRPGTAHGVLLWFDADLMDGIGFSNAPGEPELIYGQLFLPLEEPVSLSVGDQVKARIAANLVAQEYVWRWETEVWSPPESSAAPATPRIRFQQSTFLGGTLGLEKLRRVEAGFTPKLSARGEVDLFLLSRIDGNTSLGEIAVQAAQTYPEKFPRWQDALTRVAKLAIEFGA
jgi:type I protein arginine methyltransferase